MAAGDPGTPAAARPTVFLSYASEDRAAAQPIRDTLAGFGIDVWYDESELGGGDAWDQKIRRQIRECDYFMPIISAQTEARPEGYFRREWRLPSSARSTWQTITFSAAGGHRRHVRPARACPRSFARCSGCAFRTGRRPRRSRRCAAGWFPGGGAQLPTAERSRHPAQARTLPAHKDGGWVPHDFPAFPREEPGQRVRFWFQVAGGPPGRLGGFQAPAQVGTDPGVLLAPDPARVARLHPVTGSTYSAVVRRAEPEACGNRRQPSGQLDGRRYGATRGPSREGAPRRSCRQLVHPRPGARHSLRRAGGRFRCAEASQDLSWHNSMGGSPSTGIARRLSQRSRCRLSTPRLHWRRRALMARATSSVAPSRRWPNQLLTSRSSRRTARCHGRNHIPWQERTLPPSRRK